MGRSWCQNMGMTCWGGARRQGETELAGHSHNIPKPSFPSLFLGVIIDAEKSLVNKLGHLSHVI